MAWFKDQPIAHRGYHNNGSIPENSLAAVEAAIAPGYAAEIDIHLLKDGNIAVFHDDTLDRMTGVSGNITDQDAESLKPLRLGNTDHPIPLLEEVLTAVNGAIPLVIEIKSKGKDSVGPLETALAKKLADYPGDYAIQSFNPYTLAWFKQHLPNVPRGQLSGNFAGEDLAWTKKLLLSNLLLNSVSQPAFIGYDLKALPHVAPFLNNRLFGTPIVAWTIRNPDDYEKAKRVADNVIFELIVP
ncbi:MAG: glycerophosphodiester phosphodiesterase family protein [Thainema sp.]